MTQRMLRGIRDVPGDRRGPQLTGDRSTGQARGGPLSSVSDPLLRPQGTG
jgi:hypothetical protein